MLEAVIDTVRAEFSDVPDIAADPHRAAPAARGAALRRVLGYERERKGKAAGIRTHMLVSMGAALFVLVPQQAGMELDDISPVLQGSIAGIGFLCAGAIIKHRDEDDVQGLTTAAGGWLTAAIGIACGIGGESTAVMSALLALAILSLVPKRVERKCGNDNGDGDGDGRNRRAA